MALTVAPNLFQILHREEIRDIPKGPKYSTKITEQALKQLWRNQLQDMTVTEALSSRLLDVCKAKVKLAAKLSKGSAFSQTAINFLSLITPREAQVFKGLTKGSKHQKDLQEMFARFDQEVQEEPQKHSPNQNKLFSKQVYELYEYLSENCNDSFEKFPNISTMQQRIATKQGRMNCESLGVHQAAKLDQLAVRVFGMSKVEARPLIEEEFMLRASLAGKSPEEGVKNFRLFCLRELMPISWIRDEDGSLFNFLKGCFCSENSSSAFEAFLLVAKLSQQPRTTLTEKGASKDSLNIFLRLKTQLQNIKAEGEKCQKHLETIEELVKKATSPEGLTPEDLSKIAKLQGAFIRSYKSYMDWKVKLHKNLLTFPDHEISLMNKDQRRNQEHLMASCKAYDKQLAGMAKWGEKFDLLCLGIPVGSGLLASASTVTELTRAETEFNHARLSETIGSLRTLYQGLRVSSIDTAVTNFLGESYLELDEQFEGGAKLLEQLAQASMNALALPQHKLAQRMLLDKDRGILPPSEQLAQLQLERMQAQGDISTHSSSPLLQQSEPSLSPTSSLGPLSSEWTSTDRLDGLFIPAEDLRRNGPTVILSEDDLDELIALRTPSSLKRETATQFPMILTLSEDNLDDDDDDFDIEELAEGSQY